MAPIAKQPPKMLITDSFSLDIFDYDEADKEVPTDPFPPLDNRKEKATSSEEQDKPEIIEV